MNVREVSRNGQTYVFVTRGRAKDISDDEIAEFFGDTEKDSKEFIPDERNRKRIFIKDLRMGLKFCATKYGVTIEDVVTEANRLAPQLNVKQ